MREIRPPVIGIFGHIDHGKSTLVDYIRKSNITQKEAGGITQHIGAYEVKYTTEDKRERKLTFLDTPGHEAFGGIRERGASAADIGILIVSAEDGVKPQTVEALKHIKDAGLPYIVAITKIDRPGSNVDTAKQSLAENDVYVEGYGGSVPVVALSSITGEGVSDLLEMIVLLADLDKFETDNEAMGEGVIIESRLDPRKGIIGTGVVKNGVVRRGTIASSRGTTAPLRLILDAEENSVEEIPASSPIQIIGWSSLPKVGEQFKTFLKKEEALDYANSDTNKDQVVATRIPTTNTVSLPLVIKADAAGSLEAIESEIAKLSKERIAPQIVMSGVGEVSESDIKAVASTEGAVVLAFNNKVDKRAQAVAERTGVEIHSFNIIYELIDKVKSLLEEREPKIEVEELVGKAKVLKTFGATKDKQVVGGRVQEGEIKLGANVKIIRRESEIGKGKIKELQQSKVATSSVSEGNEFGTMIESRTEIAPGDIIEAFVLVTK